MDGWMQGWIISSWFKVLSVKLKDISLSLLTSSSHCLCYHLSSVLLFSSPPSLLSLHVAGLAGSHTSGRRGELLLVSTSCTCSQFTALRVSEYFHSLFLTSSATWPPGCVSFVAAWALAWVFLAVASGSACADLYQLCWCCDKHADACASIPVCFRSPTVVDLFEFPPV